MRLLKRSNDAPRHLRIHARTEHAIGRRRQRCVVRREAIRSKPGTCRGQFGARGRRAAICLRRLFPEHLACRIESCGRNPVPDPRITGGCILAERIRTVLDPATRHARPSRALTMALTFGFAALASGMAWSPAALQAAGLLTQERASADPGVELAHGRVRSDRSRPAHRVAGRRPPPRPAT